MDISTTTLSELDKAKSDLHQAEKLQDVMKKANSIIRAGNVKEGNVTTRLMGIGISETNALKIQQADFAGRIGFPTYKLTNNNASIKRLQERVKMLEKKVQGAEQVAESGSEERYTFDGGEIFVNYPIDRVQILFPNGRVEKDIYSNLRRNGWVYSPSNKAFQRKITPQAISNAVRMFNAVKNVELKEVAQNTEIPSIGPVEEIEISDDGFYEKDKLYKHKKIGYTAKYIGKDKKNKHTYEIVDGANSTFSIGDQFTPELPQLYFDIINPEKSEIEKPSELDPIKEIRIYLTGSGSGFLDNKGTIYSSDFRKETNDSIIEKIDKLNLTKGEGYFYQASAYPTGLKNTDYKASRETEEIVADYLNKRDVKVESIEVLEPNTPDEFDEAIISKLDPHDSWLGNVIKERTIKRQIFDQIEGDGQERTEATERIWKKFKDREYAKIEAGNEPIMKQMAKIKQEPIKKSQTLGQISHGVIVEYADEEGKIIEELENQGEMTTSDAQGVLDAHGEFAREKYGFGFSAREIAKKILQKGELNKPALPVPDSFIKGLEDLGKEFEAKVESAFNGIHHDYKNQYELNKAIEVLLTEKGDDHNSYSSDEKNWIRKYSGYGGLDKYGTTGKGGLFEYYTPKDVIEKMWALAYKYGYNNGSILETSVATGEFLQFAKSETRIVGYEINEFSAMICRILYPKANIYVQPFEQLFIKNNWTMKDNIESLEKFDLVIGNPPYGDFSVVSSRYMTGMGEKDYTQAKNYVEYFIRRGLDLLKPKGLLIYIVGAQVKNGGTLFLDSGNSPVKEYLMNNCNFLDAYRLPDSVFERTGVTSEIIVLQKI